jgi:hypothetical protein
MKEKQSAWVPSGREIRRKKEGKKGEPEGTNINSYFNFFL